MSGTDTGPAGQVKAFSSASEAELTSFFAYGNNFTGGVRVAAGDINGDGRTDIITGTGPGGGQVKIFDGTTFAEIRSFVPYQNYSGGIFVAAGDVNGDNLDDIVTGTDSGVSPQVKVFSGANGSEITSFLAYSSAFTGGVRVGSGDVNGDGRADIITGPGPGGGSHVRIFSGATFAMMNSFLLYSGETGGVFVAGGDINGDGRADIITGKDSGTTPRVKVLDFTSGSTLADFFAYNPAFEGGVRVASGDINADGRADIITGTGSGDSLLRAFDGATRQELHSFHPYSGSTTGIYVAVSIQQHNRIGIHRSNQFYQDGNGNGVWNGNAGGDRLVTFGNVGDTPLVGDWNGDGYDEVGVKRGGQYFMDANGNNIWNGVAGGDLLFAFGNTSDVPLVGDWDGDGDDQIGIKRGNQFYLDFNSNGVWNGAAGGDVLLAFGNSGDVPVIGDWDGDGDDQIGIHRGNQFYLDRNGNGVWNGIAGGDRLFNFGATGDVPLTGDWIGNGTDTIGVKRGSQFYLDRNSNGVWNGVAGGDLLHTFGNPNDRPLDGKWRPGAALLAAAGAAPTSDNVQRLTLDALAAIVEQAIVLWANTGLTAAQIQSLQRVTFSIVDLPGAQLGLSLGGTIVFDADAAGYGWFVDPTPADSSEFDPSAIPNSAFDIPHSMDLLSAVLHELGHELGFDHDEDMAAMLETLAAGTRRLL